MENLLDIKSNIVPNLKKKYNFFMYASVVLAVIGLIFYLTRGKTQYNSQTLAPIVTVMLIISSALSIVSIFFDIRFLKYGSALALLMATLQFIIHEIDFYSNWIIATDPVSGDMIFYYMFTVIILLVSTVLAFIAASMNKRAYYAKEAE